MIPVVFDIVEDSLTIVSFISQPSVVFLSFVGPVHNM